MNLKLPKILRIFRLRLGRAEKWSKLLLYAVLHHCGKLSVFAHGVYLVD